MDARHGDKVASGRGLEDSDSAVCEEPEGFDAADGEEPENSEGAGNDESEDSDAADGDDFEDEEEDEADGSIDIIDAFFNGNHQGALVEGDDEDFGTDGEDLGTGDEDREVEADGGLDDIDDNDDEKVDPAAVALLQSSMGVPEGFRSGFVTLIGRPNAGKSTLVNAIMGKKVAITSNLPQTTRHRLRAIYDRDDLQLIMVDTPGLHKPQDPLGEELNHSAVKALEDVDVVAMLIDSTKPVGRGDEWVMTQLKTVHCPKVLVLTKADISTEAQVIEQRDAALSMFPFDDCVVVSSVSGFNLDGFVNTIARFLPEGPRWFPKGTGTDQPIEVIIAEFIREKALRSLFDEVPYAVGVQVEDISYDQKTNFYRIYAVIYTERESQKGIIIGKKGEMIKKIGTDARVDLQKLLGAKVHLDLIVKVKKGWRHDATQIKRFGYGEGL